MMLVQDASLFLLAAAVKKVHLERTYDVRSRCITLPVSCSCHTPTGSWCKLIPCQFSLYLSNGAILYSQWQLVMAVRRHHKCAFSNVFKYFLSGKQLLKPTTECPDRYKISVIFASTHWRHKTCCSHQELITELRRSKQILVNNSFTKSLIELEMYSYQQRQNHHIPATVNMHLILPESNVICIGNRRPCTEVYYQKKF